MKRIIIPLLALTMIFTPFVFAQDVFAADGTNVTNRTQAQIKAYMQQDAASLYDKTDYSVQPVKDTTRGELSAAGKNGALKILNNIRYIAGLTPVVLDENYGSYAQAAAFVDYSIGKLTHYPSSVASKPEAMSEEDWDDGNYGARRTNIACGQRCMNAAVLDWTFDEDSGNIEVIGHRRWCLNPEMGKTGFGAAGQGYAFYAMYSFDNRGSGRQTHVAWPAENMPVEYFGKRIPWSFSVGSDVTKENVNVTLIRIGDGKTWTFSGSESYNTSDTKYFNVDNQGYGQPGCIIFRPDEIDGYNPGDQFNVEITGATASPIEYTVNFFKAIDMTEIRFDVAEQTIAVGEEIWPSVNPYPLESGESLDENNITYSSDDESIATASSDGSIKGIGPGTATITATYHDPNTGADYTATCSIIVKQSLYEVVKDNYTLTDPVYTGSVVLPTYELRDGGKILKEGTDYYVVPKDETIECDGKSHLIAFYGMGDYVSGIQFRYTVQPKAITSDMVSVSPESFEYDGASHVPDIIITYNGMTLSGEGDYNVTTEENPASVGSYSLTITGKGNYTGNYKVSYEIYPKTLKKEQISLGEEALVYNGSPQAPSVAVTDGSTTLKADTDYTITIDPSGAAGEHFLVVSGIGNYQGDIQLPYYIDKAEHPQVMPSDEYSVPYSTKILMDDILSDAAGWGFAEEDLGKELAVEVPVECTAVYKGADAANYEIVTKIVKVTRAKCEHVAAAPVIENRLEPTPTEQGSYDEVVYCTVCGEELSRTTVILPCRNEQMGIDGTPFGEGASIEAAELAILGMESDKDPAGSRFGLLQMRSNKQAKTSVTVTWKKLAGAETYALYGGKCGKNNKMQPLLTTASNKSVIKKLKKGKYYKFIVIALDENNNVVSSSKIIHVATKGGKAGNDKAVTTKAKKNKVTVKTGKSFALKAKAVPVSAKLKVSKHRAVQYESSDPNVATVSAKGVIKGVSAGTCYVYAYAQDGVAAKVKVTVK